MQIDIFDNRTSTKVIRGDILDLMIQEDDGSGKMYRHIQITLNTGFNVLLEEQALEQINRFMEEQSHD
jgi:hypothetical protein